MVEKTFRDYILAAKKEYDYRLKFAFELTEANLSTIERVAAKYSVVNVAKPARIPHQKNPLDFKNVENAEVYVVDLTTGYPASTELFHQELRQALNVAEKLVVVRNKNDPYELEIEAINTFKDEEKEGTHKTLLLTPDNSESPNTKTNLYGDAYNADMRAKIADYGKEKNKEMTKIAGKASEAEDFNKNIKTSNGPFFKVTNPEMKIKK